MITEALRFLIAESNADLENASAIKKEDFLPEFPITVEVADLNFWIDKLAHMSEGFQFFYTGEKSGVLCMSADFYETLAAKHPGTFNLFLFGTGVKTS